MYEVGASGCAHRCGKGFGTGYTWSNHRLVRVNAGRALWVADMADGLPVRVS